MRWTAAEAPTAGLVGTAPGPVNGSLSCDNMDRQILRQKQANTVQAQVLPQSVTPPPTIHHMGDWHAMLTGILSLDYGHDFHTQTSKHEKR